MNKFKKISATALAAALMVGTAVTANAEQSQAKLLTSNLDWTNVGYSGGYFMTNEGVFKVGEEEFAKWRETGKLEPTKIECDIDTSGLGWWSGTFDNYFQTTKKDADGNVTERYILHNNKETGKIETAYTLGADWCYTTNDGYTVLKPTSDVENGTFTVTVMKPDGTTFTNTIKSCVAHMDGAQWDDYVWYAYRAIDNGNSKYCCYVVADERPDSSAWTDDGVYAVYGIAKDGSITKIVDNIISYGVGSVEYADEKKFVLSLATDGYVTGVVSVDNKTISQFGFYGGITYVDDNRAVGAPFYSPAKNGYSLIDLNDGSVLAEGYKSMSTQDGKIYLVKTEDDKWGYIDANGKELAIFDDASGFIGDFAPVVKDGKAYLIDRNMNKVSEEVDAKSVSTLENDLFVVTTNDDSELLMTYDSKPTTSEPTSEPTSTPTSEPTSTPTSEPTDNPATGATGIAATFGVIALAAGAVIVAKKKRND